jgi:trimethylamine--corrinoid protein Co-methyltransferase
MVAWEAVSANRVWKQLLRDYEQPPMDPAIDEELRDYVARAKVEMGTNP